MPEGCDSFPRRGKAVMELCEFDSGLQGVEITLRRRPHPLPSPSGGGRKTGEDDSGSIRPARDAPASPLGIVVRQVVPGPRVLMVRSLPGLRQPGGAARVHEVVGS